MALQGISTLSRRGRVGRWFAATLAATTLVLAGCTNQGVPKVPAPELVQGALPPELTQQMTAATNTAIAASGASGAIIGVWVPWSGSLVTGVGTTTKGGATPMSVDMTFRAATVTRSMTCDAYYGMLADGTILPDAKVGSMIPGAPNLKDVPIKQLCDSTAGIGPLPAHVMDRVLSARDRKWAPRELASFGLAGGVQADSGNRYVDSDTGYLLLGLALERASGMSAHEYLAKYVTQPLGLANTRLPGATAATPGQNSPAGLITPKDGNGAYSCDAPTDVSVLSSSVGYTNGGVVSTITDLGTYGAALAQKTLARGKDDGRYAHPLTVSDQSPSWHTAAGGVQFAGSLMGNSGTMVGYSTSVWSDPATGVTVAVMLNNSTAGPDIARSLSWQLASLASTAPAASGKTVPQFGVPWTAQDQAQGVTSLAICPVG